MHDFCLTIPYGVIVMFGGIIGFLAAGSKASLMAGVSTRKESLLISLYSLLAFHVSQAAYSQDPPHLLCPVAGEG